MEQGRSYGGIAGGGMGPAAYPEDAKTKPASPVESGCDAVARGISGIEDYVGSLESRLQTVLGPSQPTPVDKEQLNKSASPMAEFMTTQNQRLTVIRRRLDSLLSRLEL